ncbi:uncharacterized protein LOC106648155 [Trichogramma pretiosum]|uniref:uncharacterized protein LOC106648155 n=1 Tax=Trichogramma pretiosum TaxID=7493 RepID=UPI0006C96DE0|nr:uncharacterized protein LOC106648155 [Trichogramma pretiosum]
MLGRKKGGLQSKSRRMAKKGQPAALQADVTNDDEWNKIVERPGLVVVDVYSDWSGPCTGMVSILKKIKMEIGGDNLSYATARCDNITDLKRFRGRSEPTWLFLRNGKSVNISFGANCPQLQELMTAELKRLERNDPPIFSLPVSQQSDKEYQRMKNIQEAIAAKEAAKNAAIEAKARRKYEAKMSHYLAVLDRETYIVLFPWIFQDEEGKKRDKKHSPPYLELIDQILPGSYSVEQEIRRDIDDELIAELIKETNCNISDDTRHLMKDGKAMVLRLKYTATRHDELDSVTCLINLLYKETDVPETTYELVEDCYIQRHAPPTFGECGHQDLESMSTIPDKLFCLTTAWVPLNARNKVIGLQALFTKYVNSNFPYQEEEDVPVTLFKFDSTKRKELALALEAYHKDVVNFAVFERDKLPHPKMLTKNIERFEEEFEKTSYEVFVCVVKKSSPESFLSFAGIGPYHVSETQEKALEEATHYFPVECEPGDECDEGLSEDEGEEEGMFDDEV